MRAIFFCLLGFTLGAILGSALPVLLAFYFAWAHKEGYQAGTVFAIILPFTALAGAVIGVGLGYRRARFGQWFPLGHSDTKKSFWQQLLEPSPLGSAAVQELTNTAASERHDTLQKRREILRVAYQQYQDFRWQPNTIAGMLLLCVLVPILIPFATTAAIAYSIKRLYLRKRIEFAEAQWRSN